MLKGEPLDFFGRRSDVIEHLMPVNKNAIALPIVLKRVQVSEAIQISTSILEKQFFLDNDVYLKYYQLLTMFIDSRAVSYTPE